MIKQMLILMLAGIGIAKIVRSLPRIERLQSWLESTWSKGKPLTCWSCLVFWGALAASCLIPMASLCENAVAILGAVGLGSTVMGKVEPIFPVNLPEIEELEDADR